MRNMLILLIVVCATIVGLYPSQAQQLLESYVAQVDRAQTIPVYRATPSGFYVTVETPRLRAPLECQFDAARGLCDVIVRSFEEMGDWLTECAKTMG